MDIECVRLQAKNALSALKPSEKNYYDHQDSRKLEDKDQLILKDLCTHLRLLLAVKNCSNEISVSCVFFLSNDIILLFQLKESLVNSAKHNDLICHTINLLTNFPSFCFDELIPIIEQSEKLEPKFIFENRNITAIASILEFLTENLILYANQNISADILYPVLMLCSVIAKSNTTVRHYLRNKILPPLTKNDLVNLPQNGKTNRNFLVKMMTDSNLQLKRLCAQFIFMKDTSS